MIHLIADTKLTSRHKTRFKRKIKSDFIIYFIDDKNRHQAHKVRHKARNNLTISLLVIVKRNPWHKTKHKDISRGISLRDDLAIYSINTANCSPEPKTKHKHKSNHGQDTSASHIDCVKCSYGSS